jgi:hypothetical protein
VTGSRRLEGARLASPDDIAARGFRPEIQGLRSLFVVCTRSMASIQSDADKIADSENRKSFQKAAQTLP